MSTRCHHRRPFTVAPLDVRQVDGVLSVMSGLDDLTVVCFEPDGRDHVRVGVQQLPADPRCAAAGMFGLRAPVGTAAVGLCFSGCASPTPPDGAADPELFERQRVDVVVTAGGEVSARVHCSDGSTEATVGEPGGVTVDALHRLLGLPVPGTAPPLTGLVAGMWMAEILACTGGAHPPTWSDVTAADRLPFETDRRADTSNLPRAPDPTPAQASTPDPAPTAVAASMRALADDASWAGLHHAASIGRMAAPELDPEEAAWMDTTMFARWLVDSFPAPDAVLHHLEGIGSIGTARCIDATLRHLEPADRITLRDRASHTPHADTA